MGRKLYLAVASFTFIRISTEMSGQASPVSFAPIAPISAAFSSSVHIVPNDNRKSAGRLERGILTVQLEVVAGAFRPENDDGLEVPALAFGEVGGAAQMPGPLVRVPQGTLVRASIRNSFADSALTVFGLQSPQDGVDKGLRIPPLTTREVQFRASTAGTFYYWATTGNRAFNDRLWFESQLTGAVIVDPVGVSPVDRVFVIGAMEIPGDSTLAVPRPSQTVMVINGKSWPNTERFNFTQGDSVRWRWINATGIAHPMHLHGFYYHVDSRGDGRTEQKFHSGKRPFVVTDLMLPGRTMNMSWVPERPGNWVFHCHFAFHVSHHLVLQPAALPARSDSSHATHSSNTSSAAPHRMAGLVLGISVKPSPLNRRVQLTEPRARNIRLLAQRAPKRFGSFAGLGYVVQSGATEPRRDSIEIPGPMLLLKRGEPVRITVVNHLPFPTAVHWHGIELESFPDGVPGWSGTPGRIMPPIAPADSFAAEFVPPRAGTFIYHTHFDEQLQMGSGLYGALIVSDPARPYNPETDRVILVGGAGPADSLPGLESPGLVNGSTSPPPMDLRVGTTYRLRFININPDWRVVFSMMSDSAFANWRPIAKDGADLPPALQQMRPANLLTGPGETADFEFTPLKRGDMRLEVKTMLSGWIIPIVVRVR